MRTANVTHANFIRLCAQRTVNVNREQNVLNGFIALHANVQCHRWNIRIRIASDEPSLIRRLNNSPFDDALERERFKRTEN